MICRHNAHGATLVELMMTIGISALILLGITSSMNFANIGFNTMVVRQGASSFQNSIQASLNSAVSGSCSGVIPTALNPAINTAQNVSLTINAASVPVTYAANSSVSSSLQVAQITFTKTGDSYTNSTTNCGLSTHCYTMNSLNYWPLTGVITVRLNNLAVQGTSTTGVAKSKSAYGSGTIEYTFPITLTLQQNGGSWFSNSCGSKVPSQYSNVGWTSTDSAFCRKVDGTVCPVGMYAVNIDSTITPGEWVTDPTTYTASCACEETKTSGCIAGGHCNGGCDPATGAGVVYQAWCPGANCRGTPHCVPNPKTSHTPPATATSIITCCRVVR